MCLQWIFRDWMLLKRSLANVNEQPYHIMEKASIIDRVGADNFCANIDVALTRAASLEK